MILDGVFADDRTAVALAESLPVLLDRAAVSGLRVDPLLESFARECAARRRYLAEVSRVRVSDVAGDVDGARGDRDSGRMLSTASAAALCGKSPRTVRRWCKRGRIGRMVGGTYEIDPDEFARFRDGHG